MELCVNKYLARGWQILFIGWSRRRKCGLASLAINWEGSQGVGCLSVELERTARQERVLEGWLLKWNSQSGCRKGCLWSKCGLQRGREGRVGRSHLQTTHQKKSYKSKIVPPAGYFSFHHKS